MDEVPSETAISRASILAEELRLLFGKLKRRLREQAHPGDLTTSQLSVMSQLERNGAATVTSLARALAMRPQSLGALVATLEGAGLVSGAADPADGRQTLWSLTPDCRAWLQAGRAARRDWLFQAIEKHLDAEEQDDLARGIDLLKRIAES